MYLLLSFFACFLSAVPIFDRLGVDTARWRSDETSFSDETVLFSSMASGIGPEISTFFFPFSNFVFPSEKTKKNH